MKKRTKILAIVLSCVLGGGAIFGGSLLINNAVNQVKGTDAAKILLARDRMDASDTEFKWTDIVAEVATSSNANFIKVDMPDMTSSVSAENYGELLADSAAGKVYKNGTQYIFKDISGASDDGLVIESRLYGIEYRAEQSAVIINYLKNELNIVNKWVKDGHDKYYLKVESNAEILINYYEDDKNQKSLTVVKRETREDTKCVYSIFMNDMKEGKISNPSSCVYVPGERYEYYYEHGGNSADYLIAEKERGYWNICQPREDFYYNAMVSDNFALMTTHNHGDLESKYFRIATTDLKEDVLSICEDSITIYTSAFNGINYISADESIVTRYEDSENRVSFTPENYSDKITVTLNNGSTLKQGDTFTYNGIEVKVDYMNVEYYPNPGFADPQYEASFTLSLNTAQTINGAIDILNAFLQDHDMTCKYDISEIKGFITKNKDVANNMPSYYKWNGYYIGSADSFNSGKEVLHNLWETMFDCYTQVKDEPVESLSLYSPKLDSKTTFATIESVNISNPTYSDGVVSVSNASITVKGNDLLEKNNKYVLKVGLSRVDANDNFISKNTIELATTECVSAEIYSGKTITLTCSANYQIPEILEEGRYAIVVYAATEDEGIRVSEMKAIAFANTEDDSIETVYYKIDITQNTDNTLILVSTPKLSINATIDYKATYTYADIRRVLMQKLLNVGFPTNNTQIQLEDNTIVNETDEITHGTTYKMKFKVETIDGVVDAYVYCTLPTAE